jgi:hypothetical protein
MNLYNCQNNFVENVTKIFNLPIIFNDISKLIVDLFRPICEMYFGSDKYIQAETKKWPRLYILMITIFKSGTVKTNQYNHLMSPHNSINYYYNSMYKKYNNHSEITKYINSIKYFQFICSYYNWDPVGNLKDSFDKFYTMEELINYDNDKINWINYLKTQVCVSKSKAKKQKHEIEI